MKFPVALKQFKPIKFQNLGVDNKTSNQSKKSKYTLSTPESSFNKESSSDMFSKRSKLISKISTKSDEKSKGDIKEASRKSRDFVSSSNAMMFELPDLNIYTKPINETQQKYINTEHAKALNEDLRSLETYNDGYKESSQKVSLNYSSNSLSKTKAGYKNNSFIASKRPKVQKDMSTSTEEPINFNELLKSPENINNIIGFLNTMKTSLVEDSLSQIKNKRIYDNIRQKIEDFSDK